MSGVDTEFEGENHQIETRTGRDFELHSVLVSYEDAPDECTIYPRERSHHDRTSVWLTAPAASFVDLADAR
ncbi:hypothetical protein SAMN04487950_2818 [Halogranum rubrum]|uniref:DUF7511 domain-containing protein n=1 Tax=Halogranum rubrum TaxID=553466 RepID=A0A1I4FIP1_9EURY|nr:hypothetical protein [Halogranum rubrum]SFL16331.1 hypothetical protein SAMN04487950_2818 [Halogranum rubrum]